MTPPPYGSAVVEARKLSEYAGDAYNEWEIDGEGDADWKRHRVGGWPNPVQGDMQIECARVAAGHYCGTPDAYRDPALAGVRTRGEERLLLAQISSDEAAGIMWGDDGKIYLWIRREDLVARCFEASHLVLQCY